MKNLAIFLMLLSIPKVSVSQEVVIDTINNTVLLDKVKTIELGKIIQNEEILYNENKLLKEAIEILEEKVQNLEEQNNSLEFHIAAKLVTIVELKSKIIQTSDALLDIEKGKRKYGLYGYIEGGTPLLDTNYKHLFLGAKLVTKNSIYSISINPVNSELIYAVGYGMKIF